MTTISAQTARRYLLVKQGLWHGPRWKGKKVTTKSIHPTGLRKQVEKMLRGAL